MNRTVNLTHYLYTFLSQNAKSIFNIPSFERFEIDISENISCLIDFHPSQNACVYFLRIKTINDFIDLDLKGFGTICKISYNNRFGLLLNSQKDRKKYFIWLPQILSQINLDNFQRISLSKKNNLSYNWTGFPDNQIRIINFMNREGIIVLPYVVIEDSGQNLYEEFQITNCCESRLYLKSNWFYASGPTDIWKYLINGAIYDPRADIRIKKQFKCQQCAYAWWNLLGFLFRKTQKKIYDFLQNEISYTVLADMSSNGEWGHGYWSDDLETHSRFHLDGIHLFLSQYEKTNDGIWLDAGEKAMGFVAKFLVDVIDDKNIWFLHDTLELKKRPVITSVLFGKSIGNSLCINTHLQALSVLHRLCNLASDKEKYECKFTKGIQALRRVFNYQPGEFFYRVFIEWLIKYNILKNSSGILGQAKNAVMHRLIKSIYWPIVDFFPRIVHPCGFIERDLTLSMASDRYHVINVKDLLTLYNQKPFEWLKSYIQKGTDVLREYLKNDSLPIAIQRSPYFIEIIDALYLYNKCIERISADELNKVEDTIFEQTGGYSLDYCILKES